MEQEEPLQIERPSRWHRPMWWANGCVVIGLLLSYLSVLVSPAAFWPLALFGIAYPYLLFLNLFFIAWWVFFRRKRIWPSLLAIIIGWGHVGDFLQLSGKDAAMDDPQTFKVMSYNVRLFDLYNWTSNFRTRDEIFDLLRVEDADILCLQEFFNTDSGRSFVTRDTLLHYFRWTGCHDTYTQHTRHGQYFGIATFTVFPIIDEGSIHFPDELNNLCIWTDMLIHGDTVRVYNGHLASLRFGDQDYRFMQDLEPGMSGDSLASGGRRIISRLKNAFIRRAEEVEKIEAHLRSCPHPIIWCGDLNDTPMSFSYHRLDELLEDAFVESGRGLGHTYVGDFPSFRIDHIMHSSGMQSRGFRTLPDELSDHRPVVTWMELEK